MRVEVSCSQTLAALKNHMDGLLNRRLLGCTPWDSGLIGLNGTWQLVFLTRSQWVLILYHILRTSVFEGEEDDFISYEM